MNVGSKRLRHSSSDDGQNIRKKRRTGGYKIEVNDDEVYHVSPEEEKLSKYIGDWVLFFFILIF